MYKPISHLLHSFLLLVLIGTGSSIVYYLNAPSETPVATFAAPFTPTAIPSLTPAATFTIPFTPTAVPSLSVAFGPTPQVGWSSLQTGLERRVINIYNEQNQQVESLYMWRLDQKYFRMDVSFAERPKSLDAWQKETNAALVVNGGYLVSTTKDILRMDSPSLMAKPR